MAHRQPAALPDQEPQILLLISAVPLKLSSCLLTKEIVWIDIFKTKKKTCKPGFCSTPMSTLDFLSQPYTHALNQI